MVVYAIDNKESLEQLKERMDDISQAEDSYNKKYIKMLVGNKTDNYALNRLLKMMLENMLKTIDLGLPLFVVKIIIMMLNLH